MLSDATEREQVDAQGPLLPEAASDEDGWIRQEFKIEALRDTRLPASAQPVRWRPETEAPVADENGEVVVVPDGIRRDQRYTVWSYAPRPNPSELNTFRGDYPDAATRYLEVVYQPLPEWGAAGRDTLMDVYFGSSGEFEVTALESVYQTALEVTSGAQSPYEAAALLEIWFQGGRRLRLRRAAAVADRRDSGARRLRQRDEAGLLPALRRRDGAHAAAARRPLAGGGRLRERRLPQRLEGVGRQGHERPRLGRGLVPGVRLDPVRPAPWPR